MAAEEGDPFDVSCSSGAAVSGSGGAGGGFGFRAGGVAWRVDGGEDGDGEQTGETKRAEVGPTEGGADRGEGRELGSSEGAGAGEERTYEAEEKK